MNHLNIKVILLLYQLDVIDSLTFTKLFTNIISQSIGLQIKRFPLIIGGNGNALEKARDIVLQPIIGLHISRQYVFNAPIGERHIRAGQIVALMSQQCVWLSLFGPAENVVEGTSALSTFLNHMEKKIVQDRLKIQKRKMLETLLNKLRHRGGATSFVYYFNQKKTSQYQFQCQNTIKDMFCEYNHHRYKNFVLRKQVRNYLIMNPHILNIPFYSKDNLLILTITSISIAGFLFIIFWKLFSISEKKRSLRILPSPIKNDNNIIIDVDYQHL